MNLILFSTKMSPLRGCDEPDFIFYYQNVAPAGL
jgi:hypothetical protein